MGQLLWLTEDKPLDFNPCNTSVLILAGGFGTRLKPLFPDTPKPIVPFMNMPLLYWTLNDLLVQGFKKIFILLCHEAIKIKSVLEKLFPCAGIKYLIEPFPMGTGGGIVKNFQLFLDNIIILNGDLYSEFSYKKFLSFCMQKKATACVTLHISNTPMQADLVLVNEENNVTNFFFRPHNFNPSNAHWVNAGITFLKKNETLIKNIENFKQKMNEPNFELNFEKHVLQNLLAKKNNTFFGYCTTETICDVGTPEKFNFAIKKFTRIV
jgi:NDP-sugar pyrophosphorylase family protein